MRLVLEARQRHGDEIGQGDGKGLLIMRPPPHPAGVLAAEDADDATTQAERALLMSWMMPTMRSGVPFEA